MGLDRLLARRIIEGAIFASPTPMPVDSLLQVFGEDERPSRSEVNRLLEEIRGDYRDLAVELVEVGSGWRFQVRSRYAPWVGKLWLEKPARMSRAMLETLAIIAYRQPVTRGEIEAIRGVAVSPQIVKNLLDREWIVVAGHREVPGRPALFATTRQFLDAFSLKSLSDLPPLAEVRDLELISRELEQYLTPPQQSQEASPEAPIGTENAG